MQLKTSSFNRTLFRKTLARFWPLWLVYTAVWAIMLPLLQFTASRSRYWGEGFPLKEFQTETLQMAASPAVTMALIFGVLFAMAVFSYLCTARSVGMMHSFPIRREGLFFTHYLAGLFMQLSALLVVFVLAALVQVTTPAGAAWRELVLWLGVSAGTTVFFYSFGVFCAMFTGQVLATPVFYGALNFLVVGVEWLVRNFAAVFLYGATGSGISPVALWCSPAGKLYRVLDVHGEYGSDGALLSLELNGGYAVWVYAAAGLVLAGLALAVYRRRRSESAGDTVAVNWAKPVFQYGVAFCAALGLGQGLYAVIWGQLLPNGDFSLPGALLCLLVMGLLGYFAAEMLLRKSFRVLKSGWKGGAAVAAAVVVFGLAMALDVTGFERRVPDLTQVEQVEMNIRGYRYISFTAKDPAMMQRVEQTHQAIIAEKETQRQRLRDSSATDENRAVYVDIWYRPADGGDPLRRSYTLEYTKDEIGGQGAAAQLAALYSDPWVQRQAYLGDMQAQQITGASMLYFDDARGYIESMTQSVPSEDARTLYNAISADMEAGCLGKDLFPGEDGDTITYANNLEFYYISTNEQGKRYTTSCYVPYTVYCTETIAALKALGLVSDQRPLLTEAEENARRDAYEKGVPVEELNRVAAEETVAILS